MRRQDRQLHRRHDDWAERRRDRRRYDAGDGRQSSRERRGGGVRERPIPSGCRRGAAGRRRVGGRRDLQRCAEPVSRQVRGPPGNGAGAQAGRTAADRRHRGTEERRRKRAAGAGLHRLTFQEGDACDRQGVADQSFDLRISVFGAMFAPKPFDVARELVRVTKTGGRVVMGNWIPNDPTSFVSQLLKISSSFTPPPPEGFVSPMTWGVESHIIERFGQARVPREKITMLKDTYSFISPEVGPTEFIDLFNRFLD